MPKREPADMRPPRESAVERAADVKDEAAARSFLNAVEVVEQIRGMGDTQVYLARRPEGGGEWGHLGVFPGEEFDVEMVRKLFGGGRYRMQTRGTKEGGGRGWIEGGSAVFSIEGPQKLIGDKPVAAAPNGDSGTGLSPLMTMLLESERRRSDDMNRLVLALVEGRSNTPNGGLGLADVLAAARELRGDVPSSKSIIDGQFEAWSKGMEMGRNIESPPEKADSFGSIVRDLAPVVSDAFKAVTANSQSQARRGPPPQQRPLPPRPAAPPALPAATTETGEGTMEQGEQPLGRESAPPWLLTVEPFFPLLVGMAQMAFDPDATAEQIVQKIPEGPVSEAMLADVQVAGWVERTLPLLPAQLSHAHVGWTTAVLKSVHELLTAPPEEDDEDDKGAAE